MIPERARDFGFAAASGMPVPYLERTRSYYAALGFGAPYEWAHAQVPFHRLEKPLSGCRFTLAARFHGLPTNRSHRVTLETDCPEIVERYRADRVDAALLVARRRAEFERQKVLAKAAHGGA